MDAYALNSQPEMHRGINQISIIKVFFCETKASPQVCSHLKGQHTPKRFPWQHCTWLVYTFGGLFLGGEYNKRCQEEEYTWVVVVVVWPSWLAGRRLISDGSGDPSLHSVILSQHPVHSSVGLLLVDVVLALTWSCEWYYFQSAQHVLLSLL